MIRVSQWAEIRHMHFVDCIPKKVIARRLGLNVKTVRRALGRDSAPEGRESPTRGRRLDPWRKQIEDWLREEPRISAKRIGRLLESEAGRVPERTLREYVAELRGSMTEHEAFVHRTHAPGDTAEVDFGESWAEVGGRRQKVKFLVVTLPACNAYFAKAYPVERLECLLDGIVEAFCWLGGVPRRAVLDNTSLAVKKVLKGTDRIETSRFHAFRGEWPLHVDFCAPGKGWEKGSVERGVEYVRGIFFRPTPKTSSFAELNAALLRELDRDLDRRTLRDGRTVRQALVAEREHLRPLPSHLPETCRVVSCVANKYGHVHVDRSTYSVPTCHARLTMTVKLYHDRVEIARADEVVARHERSFSEGSTVIDPLHVLSLLEKKHRAVAESTAILGWQLPAAFHELRAELAKCTRKPDQEWVQVLRLVEVHPLGIVEDAVTIALARSSPRLATVRQLLRQTESGESATNLATPLLEHSDLLAIEVAEPDLASWDVLSRGGEA